MNTLESMKLPLVRLAGCTLLGALIAIAFTCTALAQGTPVLREQVRVFSTLVTLGDLFENAGDSASAPVFRSPELGTKGVVAAKRIAAAAHEHGLEWENPGGIVEVEVVRPGRKIALEEISEIVSRHASGDDDPWTVEFTRGSKSYHIDPRIKAPLAIRHIDVNDRTGKFRAVVSAEGNGLRAEDRTFTGIVFPSIETVVPSRVIERGATIVAEDLKTVRLPRSRVPSSAVLDSNAAVGMAARMRLASDRPIRRSDIEEPKLIKRNAMVTIEYKVPGLVLKSKGKALADGARGQMVSIMNLRSKRTVEAHVTGPGMVSVSTLAAQPSRPARKTAERKGGQNTFVIR